MASQAERDAEALKQTFDGLTESIRKSAETSGKLRQTFLDLSSTANASGQAWTVISRLTSGTGFWKIQNRIRAISNFFQFQEKRLNEQVKREQEQISLIKDQIKEREKLAEAERVVLAIQDKTATMQERQAFFQSDQLKYYQLLFGRQNAVVKVTQKLATARKNLENVRGIRGEQRADQMQRDYNEKLSPSQRFFMTGSGQTRLMGKMIQALNPFQFLADDDVTKYLKKLTESANTEQAGLFASMKQEDKILFANYTDAVEREFSMREDKKLTEKRLANMQTELDEKKQKYDDEMMAEDMGVSEHYRMDSFELEQLKEEIKELMAEQKELLETSNTLEEETVAIRKEIGEDERKLLQNKVAVQRKDGKTTIQKVGKPQTTSEYLYSLLEKSPMFKIFKGLKDIPFGAIFKSLGKFLKAFLYYGTIIIAVLFLLKESGILDSLMEFMGKVVFYFIQMITKFAEGFGMIAEFFGSLFAFLGALFFGTKEETREAGRELLSDLYHKLVKGLGKIIYALGEFVIMGFFDGLWTLGTSLGTYLIGIEGKLTKLLTVMGITMGGMKGAAFGAPFGPLGMIAFGLLGAGLGGGGAKLFGETVLGGMASGGLVNNSGVYLVGEQGPELVSLAQGQYVTPNHQVGGTVNINVNGRIGASETELRDIGNRLGDIINNRGNRVGNTRMFR
jgi:hypothetical protein